MPNKEAHVAPDLIEKPPEGRSFHPSVFALTTFIPAIVLAMLGAVIGMQLIVTLGVSANTSIIGALFAILMSRIPIMFFRRFRSLDRQNLLQTVTSAATFGAANGLMVPIGIPFIMGMPELIVPLLIGAAIANVIDFTMLYGLFNSRPFPASGTWPAGVATAEALWAGDQGGRKVRFLGAGIIFGALGAAGSFIPGIGIAIPMSAAGVALIGNIWALAMFGIGLLVRGYSKLVTEWDIFSPLFPNGGLDINAIYLPHGLMIGAGIVSLFQVARQIRQVPPVLATTASHDVIDRSPEHVKRLLSVGFIAYMSAALILALMSGLMAHMSTPQLIGFLFYAACAAYISEMIVGIAAMHSGWFPAFAVGLINLIVGMLLGFPPIALAMLIGFCTAVGPAFADMGFDLKTGYLIRGSNKNRAYEMSGRRQQYIAALLGFAVAALVVALFHSHFFSQGLVPPVDRVFVSTIKAGASPDVAKQLALSAIPGALIQWLGGSKRQLGILFGTGLLINFPIAGWVVLATLIIRVIVERRYGDDRRSEISAFAGGLIAGDAIFTFTSSVTKAALK